jgi:hypothetical protein
MPTSIGLQLLPLVMGNPEAAVVLMLKGRPGYLATDSTLIARLVGLVI